MVSRDTRVHVAVVAVALASLVALDAVFDALYPNSNPELALTVSFVVLNGLVLAGAHLLLAIRGEDGLVPVDARWRFVAVVGTILALGAISILTDPVALGLVDSNQVLAALGGVAVVGYLVFEVYDGYRDSTTATE